MNFSIRPSSIDDLGAIRQLMQQAFNVNHDAPFIDPSVMAWKYWDRRGDWEEPRSYVVDRDGVVIAHAGILPLTFSAGEVRGVHMIDWVAARESRGAGVALLQNLAARFDFILAIGGSEMTRKILPAFGFKEYTRQWNGASPLRPLKQILTHQYRNWKLAPRLMRNSIWRSPTSPGGFEYEGWRAEAICPSEVSLEFYSQNMAEASFSSRLPDYFEYLLRCPAMQTHLYSIRDKRGPKGHFAIGVLRGQARLAGVWLHKVNSEAWQAAFCLAQQAAKRLEGANEIAVSGTDGPSALSASRSGLRIMGYTPVHLLNRKKNLALRPDFQFQLSDNDAFFLDSGNTCYMT
jgi:hypothetical protein